MKRLFFSAAIAALALTSCKKDKGDEQKAITVENIIGDYKLTSQTSKVEGTGQTNDDMLSLDACEKDDLFQFKTGGVFQFKDAGLVCDPDESYTGKWSMQNNILSIDGSTINGTITSLTNSKIEITATNTVLGVKLITTATLTRQ